MRFLEPGEVMALADAMDPLYRAAVMLAAYGGLRAGELFGLRAKRVDPPRRNVTIAETVVDVGGHPYFGPPKTRAGRRSIPLPRVAAGPLARWPSTYARTTASPTTSSSPHQRVDQYSSTSGDSASGPPRCAMPDCNTGAARSAAHGGGAVDGRRRRPEGGGGTGRTRRSASHSTATGTSCRGPSNA